MARHFTGVQLFYLFIILLGSIFFMWFLWPAIFKGMINAGNVCGILGCAVVVFYGIRYREVHRLLSQMWQRKPLRICLVLLAVFVLTAVILMAAAAAAIIRASSADIPQDTPAVVLGCSVKGTRPSRVLQERIDAAYAYMQEHPKAVCILSGGQGRGEDLSEAECMYEQLKKAGINADHMYQEALSTNTQENLEYSKQILDQLENSESDGTVKTTEAVTIISSEFHLYRGRYSAKELGYHDYGYAASTDWKYLPTFFLREMIAVVHLWLGNIRL